MGMESCTIVPEWDGSMEGGWLLRICIGVCVCAHTFIISGWKECLILTWGYVTYGMTPRTEYCCLVKTETQKRTDRTFSACTWQSLDQQRDAGSELPTIIAKTWDSSPWGKRQKERTKTEKSDFRTNGNRRKNRWRRGWWRDRMTGKTVMESGMSGTTSPDISLPLCMRWTRVMVYLSGLFCYCHPLLQNISFFI